VPSPESVFDLAYFRTNPAPFRKVAAELWLDDAAGPSPTQAHRLIAHLHASGKLLRCYTQNIDGLERKAGVPGDALVEAHGGFHTSSCIDCKRAHDSERVRADVLRDVATKCDGCGGLVKPDIVFFGENLGQRFADMHAQDLAAADALIIMGTSLQVAPFSTLPSMVSPTCPRLLINRDAVGPFKCNTDAVPDLGTSRDPSHVVVAAAAAAALESDQGLRAPVGKGGVQRSLSQSLGSAHGVESGFRRVASAGRTSAPKPPVPSKPTAKPTTKPLLGRVASSAARKGAVTVTAVEAGDGTGQCGAAGRAAADAAGKRCCQSMCPGCGGWQYRDVTVLGDCDEGAARLLKLLNPGSSAKAAPAAAATSSFSLKPSVSRKD
jgi:NAD-dependent SIR2 family protein deacetylase